MLVPTQWEMTYYVSSYMLEKMINKSLLLGGKKLHMF